ncbi:MAG: methyltransferase domain-containing protein [Chitinivibrionales bacterium]
MQQWLKNLLGCPNHPQQGRLFERGRAASHRLVCEQCGTEYPVIDGIVDLTTEEDRSRFFESESIQWDTYAAIYDDARANDPPYCASIRMAVGMLRAGPQDIILDAACGTGLTVRRYFNRGCRVVGLDLSINSLRYLRKQISSGQNRLGCVRANLAKLPLRNRMTSKVICANALQHLPTAQLRSTVVRELNRVAHIGGRVVISTHNFSEEKKKMGWKKEIEHIGSFSGPVQYIYRFESEEFKEFLSESMLVEKVTGVGFSIPCPHKIKHTGVYYALDWTLGQVGRYAPHGHMLLGRCTAK